MKKTLLSILTLFCAVASNAQCWREVATESWHSLGIKTDGTLWAWGNNVAGQLGNNSNVTSQIPVQINFDATWLTVSISPGTSFAIRSDGKLFGWGENLSGQVGNNSTSNVFIPVQIGTDQWQAIEQGSGISIGIKSNGTLWAWGINGSRFGVSTPASSLVPIQIGTGSNWSKISVGSDHVLAIKTDGTLWAWGENFYGQLGNGNNTQSLAVQIGTANNWAKVFAGSSTSLAIKADGTVWGWGENECANLGLGTFTNYNTPQLLPGFGNCTTMAVGSKHIVGIRNDGTLWACGRNNDGQLGIGTFTNYTGTVTQVGTATNWQKVAAGQNHTFALNSNGQMFTAGLNDQCELGILGSQNLSHSAPELVSCGTMDINTFATSKSGLYPNPATNYVSFSSEILEIGLWTLDGKQISIRLRNNQVDISELQTGIYLIKGKNMEGSFTERLIKK